MRKIIFVNINVLLKNILGLLSKAQKEAVGAAERETDLGQELDNGQEDMMDDREFERYDIDKRD